MKKYIYQKFLLQCDYDQIDLEKIPEFDQNLDRVMSYGETYSLFDIGQKIVRKISLIHLEDMIDTEDDWRSFVDSTAEMDALIIYNEGESVANPIITAYREATLKAYIYRLKKDAEPLDIYCKCNSVKKCS